MRKASVVILALGLLAVLPTASSAGAGPRFHGRSGTAGFGAGGTFHGHGHSCRKDGFHGFHGTQGFHGGSSFHKHGFQGHRAFPRHFGGFGVVVVGPPLVVFSPPLFDPFPTYYSAPVYAPPVSYASAVSPPVMYSPPAVSQPPAAPGPQVVQYPNGRYELRGDGIRTPYTWVWIPNPPPPPPPAPPSAPPADTPSGAPTSGDPPAIQRPVYHWVDEQGVAHWTNRFEAVPRRYREVAKRIEPS